MKILIASHGKLAEGLISALNIIIGNHDIDYINAYIDEKNFKDIIKDYFNKNDNLCILTDLFGGSVNQEIMKYLVKKDIHLITGVNLPLTLEIVLENKNGELTPEKILHIVENTKQQIIYVNNKLNSKFQDDFE